MRPRPGTSSPRCCRSASGSSAPSTRTPWRPRQPRPLDRGAGDAAAARDQFAALLPACERVLGAEHPDTLDARANLARWTGEAGDPAGGPGPVRRAAAGPRADLRRRAPRHPDHPRQPCPLDRGGGGSGRGPRPVRRAAAGPRAGPRRRAPGHPERPAHLACWTGEAGDPAAARDQSAALLPVRSGSSAPSTRTPWAPARPRLLDRGGGGSGRGPGPVRRAAAGPRAGLRRRAPRHPGRPAQPCPLDRGGGGSGRGPGPVRRAAAGPRADLRRRAPRDPDHPRATLPAGPGRRGIRPRPATSPPRCCP